MKVITYEEWIEQTERLTKQQVALLKAQDAIGKSAYEIALKELGKTEEELPVEDWLESLVGPPGETGPVGADGKSAYEIYLDNYKGNEGEELEPEDWLESLVGPPGETGADGKSAYELAVEGGLNDVEEGGEYEDEEPIDEETFGILLAELIRERLVPQEPEE